MQGGGRWQRLNAMLPELRPVLSVLANWFPDERFRVMVEVIRGDGTVGALQNRTWHARSALAALDGMGARVGTCYGAHGRLGFR
eukprot:229486-Chlamydomonas_euryale.AAC.1